MAGNPILAILALILTAGGLLLNIFVILSGTFINVKPINLIYFLSTGSSSWTYFSLCTLSGNQNANCGSIHPAFPFDPAANNLMNIPSAITSSHGFYYYMSRVSWSFYLIASFFAAVTLIFGIFACCTRVASFLSGFNGFLAVVSQAVCAALMTAWTIRARNAYRADGQTADIGRYAYGFTWAAFVCFFLAMIFFCSSGGRKKKSTEEEEMQPQGEFDHQNQQPVQQTTGGGFFNRNSSNEPAPGYGAQPGTYETQETTTYHTQPVTSTYVEPATTTYVPQPATVYESRPVDFGTKN